ncbi:hypothetical protein FCL53_10525 [Elizabethkingia meningoseptica]|uniref:hypothetical protein n=1 Tax=Elizabethkingia meningoseptica TaxID=238 RepID=UPI0013661FED|nr:hypothetical protein [Elizabethkingia meningoseptica]MVW92399.1 hypothetical protein [Elizabethkingia meningoseptica]
MKKILSVLLLIISLILTAQNSGLYTSNRIYEYGTYESPELIKMKTEKYLRNLIEAGYLIKKNEVTRSKIDIDFSILSKDIEIVRSKVVYEFYKSGYSAFIFHPKMYMKEDKKWVFLKEDDIHLKQIIDIIEEIIYKDYQTDINSNF